MKVFGVPCVMVAILFFSCGGNQVSPYCGEWVLLYSNGEDVFGSGSVMILNEDGTFQGKDSVVQFNGTWAEFDQGQRIVFDSEQAWRTISWTDVALSNDTLYATAEDAQLIMVRKTEENAAELSADVQIFHFYSCNDSTFGSKHDYKNEKGQKRTLEIVNQCAFDKYHTVKDPTGRNTRTEKYFYHYCNRSADLIIHEKDSSRHYTLDRKLFVESVPDAAFLLDHVKYDQYYGYGQNCLTAHFSDTSGAQHKVIYVYLRDDGTVEIAGENPYPTPARWEEFDLPGLMELDYPETEMDGEMGGD